MSTSVLNRTSVDYLKFRTTSDPFSVLEALRPAFANVGPLLDFGDQVKGVDGWEFRRPLWISKSIKVGAIDYGGHHMRGVVRVDMPGSACEWVQDWDAASQVVDRLDNAFIKRLDIALTTGDGECTHDKVLEAHARREFGTGGRHPHYRVVGGSDPRAGRTIYVGKRDSGKFLRCYEKGWEMLKDLPATMRDEVTSIDVPALGKCDPAKVYRVEVEFKDKDDRVIPWTALTDRDAYFAGAYPFCAGLLPLAKPRKVLTLPQWDTQMTLERAIDNVRRSYGPTLRALYEAYDGDAEKVLARLMTDKPSLALIEAGVLTMDHL